jgi:hypothetical protein
VADDSRFDDLAATLRADAADTRALVEALAAKLEGALPDRTSVVRRPRGLLSRERRVARLEVRFDDDVYKLDVDGGQARGERTTSVRGIVIRSEPLSLDSWIAALGEALEHEARQSQSGRIALERLLG